MSDKLTRRQFLKLTGLGAAVTAVLTGCGPTSRYVVRRPYTDLPEYQQTGKSTYYASTCRECAAGCGIVVRTFEGRAIKIEGNPNHPVNRGKICSKGLTGVQGLYNPDRIKNPGKQSQRGSGKFDPIDWNAAIAVVADALKKGAQSAFLLGEGADHLYDLVSEIAKATGAPAPWRIGAMGMFDQRRTLLEAARLTFGQAAFPYFDLGTADVVFSFGSDFLENELSPVSYSRMYRQFRQGNFGRRGYLVAFDAHQSLTASNADEWYPVTPGTEGLVALALGRLVLEARGQSIPAAMQALDPAQAAQTAGVDLNKLRKLAGIYAAAAHPLAVPGGAALSGVQGLANAQAILALNGLTGALGNPGGMYLQASETIDNNTGNIQSLLDWINSGAVQVLFIHGVNPAFELPAALGFEALLQKVPLVISFASFPDETAQLSDYVFPDHTGLESFGYKRILAGADRTIFSAMQPVVAPLYDTKASVDVLIAAAKAAGAALPYNDEVDFIQQKLVDLREAPGGSFTAPEIPSFWALWLQNGGWWKAAPELQIPAADDLLGQPLQMPVPNRGPDEYYLVTYPSLLGDGSGANRPWLQETPDPLTTVMWNSWVQINPETAKKLGVRSDDVVKLTSPAGEVEAVVYEYPAIHPDAVAMPFGQGHTALGRWAEGRGANPARLIAPTYNAAGEIAYGATLVKITPTGRRRPLSRMESKEGVYGHE